MGFFDRFKKKPKTPWEESVSQLNKGEISMQEFINNNASLPVYCSTPMGENQKGENVMWLLSNPQGNASFYPAFLTKELCYESLSSAGRRNFMIIEGTLESTLLSLDSSPVLERSGLLIYDGKGYLEIPPKFRVRK